MADPIDIDPNLGQQLFPDETTEAAIERIVAGNPAKHGVTLAERERRAREAAARMRREAPIDVAEQMYIDRVQEIGGDPDAMMVGNKPRYTMNEDGDVKDHETGEVYEIPRQSDRAPDGGPRADTSDAIQNSEPAGTNGEGNSAIRELALDETASESGSGRQEIRGGNDAPGGAAGTEPGQVAVAGQTPANRHAGGGESAAGEIQGGDTGTCAHQWSENPKDEEPCARCGMTFAEWCNT